MLALNTIPISHHFTDIRIYIFYLILRYHIYSFIHLYFFLKHLIYLFIFYLALHYPYPLYHFNHIFSRTDNFPYPQTNFKHYKLTDDPIQTCAIFIFRFVFYSTNSMHISIFVIMP